MFCFLFSVFGGKYFICVVLQGVFPGLYLVGLTADSYRVHDALVRNFSIYDHD